MSHEDDFDAEDDAATSEHTYLTFHLGDEEYAVPVHQVTEIVRLQKTFAMPDVPSYVHGVINLRGKVIPLLDVRGRFGMPDAPHTDRTVIVVVELNETTTGLLVDAVSEVADITPDRIEPRRPMGDETGPSPVRGVALREDGVVFVLDVPTLLSGVGAAPTREHDGPGETKSVRMGRV